MKGRTEKSGGPRHRIAAEFDVSAPGAPSAESRSETFHNADNGFCVLRIKARGHRDLVTVLGAAPSIAAGEYIQASGTWENHREHGLQFRATFLRVTAPISVEGREKYLGSGLIRGIGPTFAQRLASAFLQGHGVSTSRAVRIFKTYGADAIPLVSKNPYRLARDIMGIGCKSADLIAERLGISRTATVRARAGVAYTLAEAMANGHCGLGEDELLVQTEKLLV